MTRSTIGPALGSAGLALCLLFWPGTASVAEDAKTTGQWTDLADFGNVAVHAHLLPTGKVLFWPRHEAGKGNDVPLNKPRIWDPASKSTAVGSTLTAPVTFTSQTTHNMGCGSHTFLPDGRLFVAGGHVRDGEGEALAATFDATTGLWARVDAEMNDGRWYPTALTLPNGDVLVVFGNIHPKVGVNDLPQVWNHFTGQWRNLSNARLGLPLYPFMHVALDGRVFVSGSTITTRFLDTSGNGAWTSLPRDKDAVDHAATEGPVGGPKTTVQRDYGSSVMYDVGKILVVGGSDPPVKSAEVIDLNAGTLAWRQVADMNFARRQLNATLLPDGTVLVSGGSSVKGFSDASGAVLDTELWDPKTEKWTTLAAQTPYRGYHSTALLLPDATVLSAGGGHPFFPPETKDHTDIQIYSPPYLFRGGTRPVITTAPDAITYNLPFVVTTPNPSTVAQVTLVRLGSVTHSFNTNQRINFLKATPVAGGLQVTAPPDGAEAPPGHYMLFLLDTNGVPSVAKIVRL